MRKIILSCAAMLALSACKVPVDNHETTNGYSVSVLFTQDGCTVYRFMDNLNYRYFTNCSGTTMTTRSCGKGCTKEENISGGRQ